jgi:hypothetical protein
MLVQKIVLIKALLISESFYFAESIVARAVQWTLLLGRAGEVF